ncbi:hypothetical protein BH20ACI4_BH20ACI4_15480 [soil metagenome]
MPTSKLFWNEEKQQLEVETVNRKNVVKRRVCPSDQLASDVPRQVAETDNIEVDFDSDQYGNILSVRLKGGQTMPKEYYRELEIQKSQENEAIANRHPRRQADFHNPYNFVPALPRDVTNPELGDKQLCGHDHYVSDKLSGKLTVTMTVETPLIVLDTARMSLNANDPKHKEFPVQIENGKPFINSTAVKGMLRSAYEAVTNSRMSVFSETNRLAFRMEADTKFIYPALIIKKAGISQVKLLVDGNNQRQISKLELYDKVWNGVDSDKGKSTKSYSLTPTNYTENNKQQVWVQSHWDTNSHSLIVDDIDTKTGTTGNWKKGWIYLSGSNMKDKKYERVFLEYSSGKPFSLGNLEKDWEDLIANYQKIHAKEIEKRKPNESQDYLGDDPGETSWSRQIYDKDYLKLEDGTLCYAFYNGKEIEALLPVMISRRIFPKTPISLLPKELHPAKLITQLSPADRVFGWIRQGKMNTEKSLPKTVKEIGAYRGQIRFGEVECKTENAIQDFNDLPLNILGQPKPQQGRFYVAKNKEGKAQVEGLSNEKAGYNLPLIKGLRGRKVYPHHKGLSTDYWTNQNNPNEYVRPDRVKNSQNRSIKGWIKPETKFEFDIHFTNLSEVELGALIWLLDLPAEYFHRFGGGKPLGFGSVKLEFKDAEIKSGEDLKKFYMSLDSTPTKLKEPQVCKAAFEKIANQSILESFKVACKGFEYDLPIHYPRKQANLDADTKSFEWFVANNKIDGGSVKNGYVLQDLETDKGLPYLG